jgi:hypothetical protein
MQYIETERVQVYTIIYSLFDLNFWFYFAILIFIAFASILSEQVYA